MVALRIGLLGAARIADRSLIAPARQVPQTQVAAVAARDPSRAAAVASQYGIPVAHGSYEDLITDPGIDAIYNALPNSLHAPWTLKALAAGKHVLCEKPFASNAREAEQVAAAARESGLVLMEAMHYRYHPLVARFAECVTRIAPVQHVQCWTNFVIADPGDIRYDYRLAGGALMDGGCYAIDCIRMIGALGAAAEPTVLAALSDPVSAENPAVDHATAGRMMLPSAGTAWFESSFTHDGEFRADVHVHGLHGNVWLQNFILPHQGRLVVAEDGVVTTDTQGDPTTTYTWQLRAFAAAIERGEPFVTTPENAVATMRLIDDCYRAAGLPPREAT